jgi:hypothetical protein
MEKGSPGNCRAGSPTERAIVVLCSALYIGSGVAEMDSKLLQSPPV